MNNATYTVRPSRLMWPSHGRNADIAFGAFQASLSLGAGTWDNDKHCEYRCKQGLTASNASRPTDLQFRETRSIRTLYKPVSGYELLYLSQSAVHHDLLRLVQLTLAGAEI